MHVRYPLIFGHVGIAGTNVFGLQLVFVDWCSSGSAHDENETIDKCIEEISLSPLSSLSLSTSQLLELN